MDTEKSINNGGINKMEGVVELKYPHYLSVWTGVNYSGDNSAVGDGAVERFIGSEIEPMKIGMKNELYTGNGSFKEQDYFLIVQAEKPILVKRVWVTTTSGYETKKVEYSWEAFTLPGVKREDLVWQEGK